MLESLFILSPTQNKKARLSILQCQYLGAKEQQHSETIRMVPNEQKGPLAMRLSFLRCGQVGENHTLG